MELGQTTDAIACVSGILLRRRITPEICAELAELTEAQAYAVQARVAAALCESVGGWKVAIVAGRPVAAPLLRSTLLASGQSFACPRGVDMKIETELGFTLARDLPSGWMSRDELLGAIGNVHAAFEIVGARAGEPPAVPFTAFLADNLGNAATVIGEGRALNVLPKEGRLQRDRTQTIVGGHPHGDALSALLAYTAVQADELGGLKRGQIIITGSFTGARLIGAAGHFKGEFDGLEPVEVTLTVGGNS